MSAQTIRASANFFLDSCAFDPKFHPEDSAARTLWELHEKRVIRLMLVHSNKSEINHPNTPDAVKKQALLMIHTLNFNGELVPDEKILVSKILKILQGNAQSGKHEKDANHLFEASKYCGYFITTDERILRKSCEICEIASVMGILKPSEVMSKLYLY